MYDVSSPMIVRPSFREGIARILDFRNVLSAHRFARSSEEADARAIAANWKVVGNDLRAALETFDRSLPGTE